MIVVIITLFLGFLRDVASFSSNQSFVYSCSFALSLNVHNPANDGFNLTDEVIHDLSTAVNDCMMELTFNTSIVWNVNSSFVIDSYSLPILSDVDQDQSVLQVMCNASVYSMELQEENEEIPLTLYLSAVKTMNHIVASGLLNDKLAMTPYLSQAYVSVGDLSVNQEFKASVIRRSSTGNKPVDPIEDDGDGSVLLPPEVPGPKLLTLFFLGDWGKGGINGDITRQVASYAGNDNNKNKNGGGGNNNNKVTYTYQMAIARAMAFRANTTHPSAVVALGDNFYTNGVASTTDSIWTTHFESVYLDPHPSLRVPWYPVFGNHDYGYGSAGIVAQMARYTQPPTDDGLWTFPSTNYSRRFSIPGGSGSVVIVFIDTTTLAPSENKCCNEKGGVSLETQSNRISNQLFHIERMLQEASADPPSWLIVAGHYPVFSSGGHGDTDELLVYLLPLLLKYNVSAYICGHDHFSEHLTYQGTNYFIAGGGSMTDSLGSVKSEATSQWAGPGFSAFMTANFAIDSMRISFVNMNDEEVYSHESRRVFHPTTEDPPPTDSLPPSSPPGGDPAGDSETFTSNSKSSFLFEGILCGIAFLTVGAVGLGWMKHKRRSKETKDAEVANLESLGAVSVDPGKRADTEPLDDDEDEFSIELDAALAELELGVSPFHRRASSTPNDCRTFAGMTPVMEFADYSENEVVVEGPSFSGRAPQNSNRPKSFGPEFFGKRSSLRDGYSLKNLTTFYDKVPSTMADGNL